MPLLYRLLHDHTLALSLLCMLLALCSICLCLLSMHRGYSIHSMFPRRSASGHGCSFSSLAAFVQSRQRKIPCFCPSICLCGFTGSWCCSLPSSIISASHSACRNPGCLYACRHILRCCTVALPYRTLRCHHLCDRKDPPCQPSDPHLSFTGFQFSLRHACVMAYRTCILFSSCPGCFPVCIFFYFPPG